MTDAPLYLDRDGDIARIVLNRPDKRNAMTEAMWGALPGLAAEADADPAIKVVILTSSSPQAFSAGADIAEFAEIAKSDARKLSSQNAIRGALHAVKRMVKPTMAEVRGACMGAGCGLAVACDLRVADETARFAITPAKLGLLYPLADLKTLVDLIGPARAKSMLYTGRAVGADEALRIGLIDEATSADALRDRVVEFARIMAENSQFSIRGTKAHIQMILDGSLEDTDQTSGDFRDAFAGEDYQEGSAAFLAKRKPRFTYR